MLYFDTTQDTTYHPRSGLHMHNKGGGGLQQAPAFLGPDGVFRGVLAVYTGDSTPSTFSQYVEWEIRPDPTGYWELEIFGPLATIIYGIQPAYGGNQIMFGLNAASGYYTNMAVNSGASDVHPFTRCTTGMGLQEGQIYLVNAPAVFVNGNSGSGSGIEDGDVNDDDDGDMPTTNPNDKLDEVFDEFTSMMDEDGPESLGFFNGSLFLTSVGDWLEVQEDLSGAGAAMTAFLASLGTGVGVPPENVINQPNAHWAAVLTPANHVQTFCDYLEFWYDEYPWAFNICRLLSTALFVWLTVVGMLYMTLWAISVEPGPIGKVVAP